MGISIDHPFDQVDLLQGLSDGVQILSAAWDVRRPKLSSSKKEKKKLSTLILSLKTVETLENSLLPERRPGLLGAEADPYATRHFSTRAPGAAVPTLRPSANSLCHRRTCECSTAGRCACRHANESHRGINVFFCLRDGVQAF